MISKNDPIKLRPKTPPMKSIEIRNSIGLCLKTFIGLWLNMKKKIAKPPKISGGVKRNKTPVSPKLLVIKLSRIKMIVKNFEILSISIFLEESFSSNYEINALNCKA